MVEEVVGVGILVCLQTRVTNFHRTLEIDHFANSPTSISASNLFHKLRCKSKVCIKGRGPHVLEDDVWKLESRPL